jgi:dolichyl-phosphate beta-glucosyltransferase
MSQPDLTIVVPAFNEAARILQTLSLIQRFLNDRGCQYEVIVSADGTDGTRDLAADLARRDPRIKVIGEPVRRGKGRGIREGVRLARGRVIGFVDADYKTPIEEIDKILPWFEQGYQVVIGSRGLDESRVEVPQPFYRRVGSRCFGYAMHRIVGLRGIRDTQCGFKFFDRATALDLFGRQRIDGYMFDVEILFLAAQSGYRMKEVGVRWKDDGDSRLDLVSGNWRNMLDLFSIRFGAAAPVTLPERVEVEK